MVSRIILQRAGSRVTSLRNSRKSRIPRRVRRPMRKTRIETRVMVPHIWYHHFEKWRGKTSALYFCHRIWSSVSGTIARSRVRWILICNNVDVSQISCIIFKKFAYFFRAESAEHEALARKSLYKSHVYETGGGRRSDQRSVYALVTPEYKSFLRVRYMHDCVYIYRACIDRACSRARGRLSRIFQKSGKNYRLRTARRIVQTAAGNLDKWRLNDSRPMPTCCCCCCSRPSTRCDKKVSRSNSPSAARLTSASISL